MEENKLFEDVNNYTKFKLIEMLIEKHQNRFKDFKNL